MQLPKESAVMMDKIIEAQPEFAYRSHAELVMDLIRRKYEEKLTKLEDTIKKLTTVGKGKRYEKAVDQVGKILEDVDDMQEIVGEDGGLADRLEEMKLKLSSINTVK